MQELSEQTAKRKTPTRTISELLKDLVGNVDDFLCLRQFVNGGSGAACPDEGSDGTVAEEVGGDGDTDEDITFSGTPTGRISWIDLRS